MTELRAPGHDPIPIGEVVKAPFARLPNPLAMFAGRGQRLKALADGHTLRPYLLFLADLSDIQHRLKPAFPIQNCRLPRRSRVRANTACRRSIARVSPPTLP